MHSSLSNGYITAPVKALSMRQIYYPQSRGLGGTTNINALIFTLGHPQIFNSRWPTPWNAQFVAMRLEEVLSNAQYSVNKISSFGLVKRIIESNLNPENSAPIMCKDKLYWDIPTRNRGKDITAPTYLSTVRVTDEEYDNRSSATDIIKPIKDRKWPGRLTIMKDCQALRVIFDDRTSIGLSVRDRRCSGRCNYLLCGSKSPADSCRCGFIRLRPEAGGEIILSAGVFGSPRILALSGLGPEPPPQPVGDAMRYVMILSSLFTSSNDTTHSFPPLTVRDEASKRLPTLEAIGQNLQDHCLLPLLFACNWWEGSNRFFDLNGVKSPKYPLNCIHGWLNLDKEGNVIRDNETTPV